ncbi:hypothetical protein Tco_0732926 [Tanacetum coccineum]
MELKYERNVDDDLKAQTGLWFSNFLLRVSDGAEEVINEDYVRIPNDMTIPYTYEATSKAALINEIFLPLPPTLIHLLI